MEYKTKVILLATILLALLTSSAFAESIDDLHQMLKSSDVETRLKAAKLLNGVSWTYVDPVYKDVLGILEDENEDGRIRAYAAELVYRRNPTNRDLGKPLLLGLFSHPEIQIRKSAVFVARNCWIKDSDFIQPLFDLISDEDQTIRWAALGALNQRKFEIAEYAQLLSTIAASDEYWAARKEALQLLGKIIPDNETAARAFIAAIDDKQPDVVNFAARYLPDLGILAAPAIPKLAVFVEDSCYSCNYMGVGDALAKLAEQPELRTLVTDSLVGLLANEDKYIVSSTCQILREYKADDPRVKAAALEMLKHQKYEMRYMGGYLLTETFLADPETVGPLIEMLADRDKLARGHAAQALGAREGLAEAALPLLVDNLNNYFYAPVRAASAAAIGQIGVATPEVEAALAAAISDTDEEVAIRAIVGMHSLGLTDPAIGGRLVELMESKDIDVVARAKKLFAHGGGSK